MIDFSRKAQGVKPRYSFEFIAGELLKQSESVVRELLPAAQKRGQEFVVGSLQGEPGESCSINVRTGAWREFAGNESGPTCWRCGLQSGA
jgi:putative DNA primase/helicase